MVWILNGKENKDAGTICFDAKGKKIITYYGSIPSKIDKCDVRKLGIIKELPEESWI